MRLIIIKKILKNYVKKNIENISNLINMLKIELNKNNKEKLNNYMIN